MKRFLLIGLIISALLFHSFLLSAKEYKVAVKELPATEQYIAMIKAIIEASGNTATFQVLPPARADYVISNKDVDIQFPIVIIPDKSKHKDLQYDYSTIEIFKTPWVLFTNKNKSVNLESLKKGNPDKLKIETDPSRLDDFNFAAIGSSNYEASFNKLSNGTIDGIILSQSTGDATLKKLALKNIKRELWFEYVRTFSLQKGARGGEVDKMLALGIEKLKSSPNYDELIGKQIRSGKYDNWQP